MTVEVIQGDCRNVVPLIACDSDGYAFDFVFADPPFNIGHPYRGYDDRRDDYDEFTAEWIRVCWQACRGVMALHGPDSLVDLFIDAQRKNKMRRIAWINWHYRFGQCTRSNWIDARCHCLIYARPTRYCWNPESVLVDSDRSAIYNDSRVDEYERGGQRLPGTVWGVPSDGPNWGRVQGTNKERRAKHSNQLPERYLERLIKAYTHEGYRVLDPFGGSGTTAVVADALNRDCVTIDVSGHNVDSIERRLEKGAVRI